MFPPVAFSAHQNAIRRVQDEPIKPNLTDLSRNEANACVSSCVFVECVYIGMYVTMIECIYVCMCMCVRMYVYE